MDDLTSMDGFCLLISWMAISLMDGYPNFWVMRQPAHLHQPEVTITTKGELQEQY